VSHATYEFIKSHMDESCHTYEWDMSRMNKLRAGRACVSSMSRSKSERPVSHATYESITAHLNESCHV